MRARCFHTASVRFQNASDVEGVERRVGLAATDLRLWPLSFAPGSAYRPDVSRDDAASESGSRRWFPDVLRG